MWNGVYVWVKPLDYSSLETDWETTLLIFVLNFTAPRYAILFLNSKIYIVLIINHEWNRSMYVASAVCFVWDTKPDLPTTTSPSPLSVSTWCEEQYCRPTPYGIWYLALNPSILWPYTSYFKKKKKKLVNKIYTNF